MEIVGGVCQGRLDVQPGRTYSLVNIVEMGVWLDVDELIEPSAERANHLDRPAFSPQHTTVLLLFHHLLCILQRESC